MSPVRYQAITWTNVNVFCQLYSCICLFLNKLQWNSNQGMYLKISPANLRPFCSSLNVLHDDVIKLKHFPRSWPFVRGIHRSPRWIPRTKASDAELYLVRVCINGRVNNRKPGDLRRHRAHYDVMVMKSWQNESVLNQRWRHIDGLVQDCSISIASALEILQSCTESSIFSNRIRYSLFCVIMKNIADLRTFNKSFMFIGLITSLWFFFQILMVLLISLIFHGDVMALYCAFVRGSTGKSVDSPYKGPVISVRLNKLLTKQLNCPRFETQCHHLWRQCIVNDSNVILIAYNISTLMHTRQLISYDQIRDSIAITTLI